MDKKAVLSQGEPRDAALNFDSIEFQVSRQCNAYVR